MSPSVFQLHNAQVLHGAKDLRLEQRTSYPPREGQAQVAIMATGLCGSDRMFLYNITPARCPG
jgi:L-iditol 2-dehydrogenase